MNAARVQEEEEFMTLQPISQQDDEGRVYGGAVDQDTSMQQGFISKLRKKDKKFDNTGILTPCVDMSGL